MKNILNKIYNAKFLNQDESYQLFKLISSGNIKDVQLASILTAMQIRGESTDEIIGAIRAFLENMRYFPQPNYIFSDIVGTGGDSSNTMNISTASAFVAAACGFKIIKHCNKAISSTSGSSDLLSKFNINLNASLEKSIQTLDHWNICFLFAPKYHDGFKYSDHVRKTLKIKTIFNLLGPFLNPAKPPFSVIGVYNKKLINPVINILKILKYKRAIVLHSHHTDEVTLSDVTYVSELLDQEIYTYELTSKDFGLEQHPKNIFKIHSIEDNYEIFKKIMQGRGNRLDEELIAANVAMIFKIFGHNNLQENTQLALNKIRSGEVYKNIKNISDMLKEDKYARNNT
ncbi:anthranilate phosphoribosyltransferase [Buchnera aphidicola (Macrosiphoniella sanborni)]|uniref:Anthranilate phosphoribosyltransferase n=1 Tax=Buchnera aphidicola (Macrosiphoniella sanborni) TaxID=1241865 RepID=A0A4D6Y431_9GAMM|nr:anthranilate phosphoribosyltransferase [Buchnera aphidicola]QCI23819.1 anthranilate phosphoribosyltransferase [Buchnera aphidicola (Macrosiphoniella sanborni)]